MSKQPTLLGFVTHSKQPVDGFRPSSEAPEKSCADPISAEKLMDEKLMNAIEEVTHNIRRKRIARRHSSEGDDGADTLGNVFPTQPKRFIIDSDDESSEKQINDAPNSSPQEGVHEEAPSPKEKDLFDASSDEESPSSPPTKTKRKGQPKTRKKRNKTSTFLDDEASDEDMEGDEEENEEDVDDNDAGSLKDFINDDVPHDDVGPMPMEDAEQEIPEGTEGDEGTEGEYAMYEGPEEVFIPVEFKDLYNGILKTFRHVCGSMKQGAWTNVSMVMTIRIPPRTSPGVFRRLRHSGGYYFDIQDQADIIVHLVLDSLSSWFSMKEGSDLDICTKVHVNWVDAIVGKGTFLVRNPSEPTEFLTQHLEYPVQNAEDIYLKGMGMISPTSGAKGSLVCRVIIIPPSFSDERIINAFYKCVKALESENALEAYSMADRVLGSDIVDTTYC